MIAPLRTAVIALFCCAAVSASAHAQGSSAASASNRLFADSRMVNADRLSVEVVGTGPDVVFIPGLASSRATWRRTAERLRSHYRVHLIQVAGFAGEPAGANASGPVFLPTTAAIDTYIVQAGLKRPAVVGHSLGGLMALELAMDHPADVGKVMIVDTLAYYGEVFAGPSASVEGAKPYADQMSAGMLAADNASFAASIHGTMAAMVTAPADVQRVEQWSLTSNRATMVQAFREDLLTDLRPRMASITVPVTVIYEAALGPLVQGDYAPVKTKTLVAAAPAAKHFIMYDDPTDFDKTLDTFLAS